MQSVSGELHMSALSNIGRSAAVALHRMHYNSVRIHQTLRVTPAMAAGVSDRMWEVPDLVALFGSF